MAGKPAAVATLRYDRLPQLAARMPAAVSASLRRGAFACQARAMAKTPVRTGFLRASHFVEGARPGSLRVTVGVGAAYGVHVHEGTRRTPGRPWLREAAEQTFPEVIDEMKALEAAL